MREFPQFIMHGCQSVAAQVRRNREDKLIFGGAFFQGGGSPGYYRQEFLHLVRPAARHQYYNRSVRLETKLCFYCVSGIISITFYFCYFVHYRMAHEFALNAGVPVKLSLERQYYSHCVDQPADCRNPLRSPGPNLGTHIIEYLYAVSSGLPGKTNVEIGIVYKHNALRSKGREGGHNLFERLSDFAERPDRFDKS